MHLMLCGIEDRVHPPLACPMASPHPHAFFRVQGDSAVSSYVRGGSYTHVHYPDGVSLSPHVSYRLEGTKVYPMPCVCEEGLHPPPPSPHTASLSPHSPRRTEGIRACLPLLGRRGTAPTGTISPSSVPIATWSFQEQGNSGVSALWDSRAYTHLHHSPAERPHDCA